MHMSQTVASIFRCWYIFLLGLGCTAGMAWGVYNYVPPVYETTGSALLMPAKATVGVDGNPFLFLGGMSEVLDVLVRRSSAAEIRESLLKQYDGASFTVQPDRTTSSPIIVVSVEAPSEEVALNLLHSAMTMVEHNLDSMQTELSVSPKRRIHADELVVDAEATVNNKMQLQLAIVVMGGGLVGTLMLTGFVDGYIGQRRLRRRAGSSRKDGSGEPDEPSPTEPGEGKPALRFAGRRESKASKLLPRPDEVPSSNPVKPFTLLPRR